MSSWKPALLVRTAVTFPARLAKTSKSLPLSLHTSAAASCIVAVSSVVIKARTFGKFARRAADLIRRFSRCFSKLW